MLHVREILSIAYVAVPCSFQTSFHRLFQSRWITELLLRVWLKQIATIDATMPHIRVLPLMEVQRLQSVECSDVIEIHSFISTHVHMYGILFFIASITCT